MNETNLAAVVVRDAYEWTKLASDLMAQLAWPLVAVLVIVMFRSEVSSLLKRMKRGKIGSAEAEFERDIQEVKSNPEFETIDPTIPSFLPEPTTDDVLSPRDTIIRAWLRLESSVLHLAQRYNLLPAGRRANATRLVEVLKNRELLTDNQVRAYFALRDLRNQAAHDIDFAPSGDSIADYEYFAAKLAWDIDQKKDG